MVKKTKVTVEFDEKDIDILDLISEYLDEDWTNFDDPRRISKQWHRTMDKVWVARSKNDA